MASWWKNRSKQVRLERLADRSYQIYQAQMDETLELIQISLMGLMDTKDAKTSENIAYRNLFNAQYDHAMMDLEVIANRIRGNSIVEDTIKPIVVNIVKQDETVIRDKAAIELTKEEEEILQQVDAELEKEAVRKASAKPISIASIITRAQAALVP